MAHSDDGHPVEGGIRLAIAPAVQPVSAGLATRGRHGADAAELCECGFGPDPLRIVAENDQHIGDGAGRHARRRHQNRSPLAHQSFENGFMLLDFRIQDQPSSGQRPQRYLR